MGILLGRGVVEGTGHNVDNAVWDSERLVKRFAVPDHFFKHVPRGIVLRRRHAELFDFFELVHAEDSKSVTPVAASFLAEARGEACVAKGQSGGVNPLVEMVGSDRLFAGGNQVSEGQISSAAILRKTQRAAYFSPPSPLTLYSSSSNWLSWAHAAIASFSMKNGVCRGVYLMEMRRETGKKQIWKWVEIISNVRVLAANEERNAVVDEREVELHASALQEVATAACNSGTALEVGNVGHGDEVNVAADTNT